MAYQAALQFLVDLGLLDVLLPFTLIFIITFGILQKNKVLGDNKNASAMVAFVFGFLAVLVTSTLTTIQSIVAYLTVIIIMQVMLALVLGLVGLNITTKNKVYVYSMLGLFFLATAIAFMQAGAITQRQASIMIVVALVILAVGIALYYLLRKQ